MRERSVVDRRSVPRCVDSFAQCLAGKRHTLELSRPMLQGYVTCLEIIAYGVAQGVPGTGELSFRGLSFWRASDAMVPQSTTITIARSCADVGPRELYVHVPDDRVMTPGCLREKSKNGVDCICTYIYIHIHMCVCEVSMR